MVSGIFCSLKRKVYLCNLRSNMCNSSFHSGLHPSFATLFSTSSRTIVASSLQKEGPFGSNNRFKPCCNLGLNGVSNRVANPVSNPVANKKNTEINSRCLQSWVGTVVHTRWNGPRIVT